MKSSLQSRIKEIEMKLDEDNQQLDNKVNSFKNQISHHPGLVMIGLVSGFGIGFLLSRKKLGSLFKTVWKMNRYYGFYKIIKTVLSV